MHVFEWLWDYFDTASKICIACSCTEFYGEISDRWKDVIIPTSIPINNDNLMPIMICAQNIKSLTINFPFDIEEETESERLMLKMMKEQYGINVDDDDDDVDEEKEVKEERKVISKKKTRPIKYPSIALNPSYLTHLKNIEKIDFKSCGSSSYESFIISFILQLSKFITLTHLCLPQLYTIRHNCLQILDIHQLQIGFDGMNVHLGADLIGITHFKKQIPSIKKIYCDELYLFIGEDIYINHDKSGKQYWIVMRKWCNDVNIKVYFKNPSITILLMPHDKKTPPLLYEKWENISVWLQDRVGDFINFITNK